MNMDNAIADPVKVIQTADDSSRHVQSRDGARAALQPETKTLNRPYKGTVNTVQRDSGYITVGHTYYKFRVTNLLSGANVLKLTDLFFVGDEVDCLIGASGISQITLTKPLGGSTRRRPSDSTLPCCQCRRRKFCRQHQSSGGLRERVRRLLFGANDSKRQCQPHRQREQQGEPRQRAMQKIRPRSHSCVLDYVPERLRPEFQRIALSEMKRQGDGPLASDGPTSRSNSRTAPTITRGVKRSQMNRGVRNDSGNLPQPPPVSGEHSNSGHTHTRTEDTTRRRVRPMPAALTSAWTDSMRQHPDISEIRQLSEAGVDVDTLLRSNPDDLRRCIPSQSELIGGVPLLDFIAGDPYEFEPLPDIPPWLTDWGHLRDGLPSTSRPQYPPPPPPPAAPIVRLGESGRPVAQGCLASRGAVPLDSWQVLAMRARIRREYNGTDNRIEPDDVRWQVNYPQAASGFPPASGAPGDLRWFPPPGFDDHTEPLRGANPANRNEFRRPIAGPREDRNPSGGDLADPLFRNVRIVDRDTDEHRTLD